MKNVLKTAAFALLAAAVMALTACEKVKDNDTSKLLMLLGLAGPATAPAAPVVPDTLTVPAAPGAATVTPADEQLTLSWSAVDGATAYEVWYHTADDSTAAVKYGDDVTDAGAVMTGLANGTTYYVWLKAKNAAGTSDFSPGASGTPDFNVAAVSSLAASTAVNSITLAWTDPEADEFDRVEITWSPGGSTPQTVSPGTRTFEIAVHADGTPYAITVRSVFADGRYFDATVATTGEVPVATADELNNVRNDLTAHYILTADIDLSSYVPGEGWVPIGTDTDRFTGSLNGNGRTIANLAITRPSSDCQGLFGYIGTEGSVRDLGIAGGSVKGQTSVGGLAGFNYGALSNCYATGAITGNSAAGGLVGFNYGTVTDCHATGAVTKSDSPGRGGIGGLIGYNDGTVNRSQASGAVSGINYIGGLIGVNLNAVSMSYATGNVSGVNPGINIGGLVGCNIYGTMNDCYAAGNVSAPDNSSGIGGLVGLMYEGSLTKCYAVGSVTYGAGSTDVGGLVGLNDASTVNYGYYYQSPNNGIGTQLTEAQMKDLNSYLTNYAGFDFTGVWAISGSINNGFPYLRALVP